MKKNILLLGGNSKNNLSWINNFNDQLNSTYEVTNIIYEHWVKDTNVDLEKEVISFSNLIRNYGEYYVVAKSLGTVISLMSLKETSILPKYLFLLGFPLNLIIENNIDILSKIEDVSLRTNVVFIHQKNDPLGSVSKLSDFLPTAKIIEIPGADHQYDDFLFIKDLINSIVLN